MTDCWNFKLILRDKFYGYSYSNKPLLSLTVFTLYQYCGWVSKAEIVRGQFNYQIALNRIHQPS